MLVERNMKLRSGAGIVVPGSRISTEDAFKW